MQRAESLLDQTASNIAALPASASPGDTVDLSTEMVSLLTARNNFDANTKALTVEDQIAQSTIDLIG